MRSFPVSHPVTRKDKVTVFVLFSFHLLLTVREMFACVYNVDCILTELILNKGLCPVRPPGSYFSVRE